MERLARELRKLIDARIEQLRDDISAGFLNDMAEYKKLTGHIEGLKAALDILEQAISNINKE
jgi:predicted  nucleic acid-binding Zn-ribbon protein